MALGEIRVVDVRFPPGQKLFRGRAVAVGREQRNQQVDLQPRPQSALVPNPASPIANMLRRICYNEYVVK